jgi:hypothetical protein
MYAADWGVTVSAYIVLLQTHVRTTLATETGVLCVSPQASRTMVQEARISVKFSNGVVICTYTYYTTLPAQAALH